MDAKTILNRKARKNDCTAAVIVRDGQVLLGNRVYPEKNLSVWNFPGGRCDEGETIGESLTREVNEEIGVNESNFQVIDFIKKIKGSWKDDVLYLFHCKINQEPKLMEPEKFKEWKWFNLKDGLITHFNDDALKAIREYLKERDLN